MPSADSADSRIVARQASAVAYRQLIRQRAEFVRTAIHKAIRETEEDRTHRAYQVQPDSEAEADDWSSAESWEAGLLDVR